MQTTRQPESKEGLPVTATRRLLTCGCFPSVCSQMLPRAKAQSDAKVALSHLWLEVQEKAAQVGELVMSSQTCSPSSVGQRCMLGVQHCLAVHAAHTRCLLHNRQRAGCNPTAATWPAPALSVFFWNIKKVRLCLDYQFWRNQISRHRRSFLSWIASFVRSN